MDDQTSAAPKVFSLPQSITLGGTEYKVSDTPELQAFITAVGSVERSKIQSVVRDLRQKLENMPNPEPATVNIQEIAAAVTAAINPQLQAITDRLNATEKETVDAYRTRLVSELGETVIPELIQGNTKEALDASVSVAQAARSRYNVPAPAPQSAPQPSVVAPAAAPVEAVNIANPQTILPAPAAPVAPSLSAPQPAAPVNQPQPAPQVPAVPARSTPDYTGPNISDMSTSDFGKNRDSLFQQLQQLVP